MRSLASELVDLWRARELLRQLVAKELKVRYERSALGFLWTLVTPALMTAIFTAVFDLILGIDIEDFPAFFLSGYLVWAFFQNSVQGSVQTITANGALIRKVYFPREVLPLSIVLAQGVHFALALLVVGPYLVWARGVGVIAQLPVVVLGFLLVTVLASGLAMLFAAVNVTIRDLQEFVVVIFLIWFYATPVVYPYETLSALVERYPLLVRLVDANPMTWFVRLFRAALYEATWPAPGVVAAAATTSAVVFAVGYVRFGRHAVTFAKEV